MTGALSPTHWLILLAVVLLLFGAKRLPDAARGLGTSMRIFKAETAPLTGDGEHGRRSEASTGPTDAPATGAAGDESHQARPVSGAPDADPAPARTTTA